MTVESSIAAAQNLLERGDTSGARPLLNEVLTTEPANVHARFWLGVCNQFEGNLEGAETVFRQVVAADPHFAKAWYGLGRVLEAKGEGEAAHGMYYRAASEGSGAASKRLDDLGLAKPARPEPSPPPPERRQPAPSAEQPHRSDIPPSQPQAPPVPLRSLVPVGLRMTRGLALLILTVAVLVSILVFAALVAAVLTEPEVPEENGWLVASAGAIVVLFAIRRTLRRAANLRLRGVARDVAYRQERSGGGFRNAGNPVNMITFNLVVSDSERHRVPLVAVDMQGRHMRGVLREGQEVEVGGHVKRGNYLSAHKIKILSTGEIVSAKGATFLEVVVPWLPAIILAAIVIAVIAFANTNS